MTTVCKTKGDERTAQVLQALLATFTDKKNKRITRKPTVGNAGCESDEEAKLRRTTRVVRPSGILEDSRSLAKTPPIRSSPSKRAAGPPDLSVRVSTRTSQSQRNRTPAKKKKKPVPQDSRRKRLDTRNKRKRASWSESEDEGEEEEEDESASSSCSPTPSMDLGNSSDELSPLVSRTRPLSISDDASSVGLTPPPPPPPPTLTAKVLPSRVAVLVEHGLIDDGKVPVAPHDSTNANNGASLLTNLSNLLTLHNETLPFNEFTDDAAASSSSSSSETILPWYDADVPDPSFDPSGYFNPDAF